MKVSTDNLFKNVYNKNKILSDFENLIDLKKNLPRILNKNFVELRV